MSDRELIQAKDLNASEQFFRSVFENAQIGISVFSIDRREHFSNRAMSEMLGYSEEELCQLEKWDEITHPDDRIASAERYSALLQGRRDKDAYEQRFIGRDGRIVFASGKFTLLRDAEGRPEYVVALTEDITERNRVAKQMEMLLESTGQGIYGIDLQGNCTLINRAACELVGYRPEELLGRNMHELVHHHKPDGSYYPINDCPVFRAFSKGEGCRVDNEVMWRRDGSRVPVEYSSFPILEGGRITGAVVTVLDNQSRAQARAGGAGHCQRGGRGRHDGQVRSFSPT